MAKREKIPPKNTLSVSTLLKVKADKLKAIYAQLYSRDKYKNKKDAAKRLSAKIVRLKKADRKRIIKSVNSHLAYWKRKKVSKPKPQRESEAALEKELLERRNIKFEFSHETKNYLYYRTAWIIPEGYENMFWVVYGETTQDFVEKNSLAEFIGFKYAVYRNVGTDLIQLSDEIYTYSPHFSYDDFFLPDINDPNVNQWYKTIFQLTMSAKLRRYFEDQFRILVYYIVVRKD